LPGHGAVVADAPEKSTAVSSLGELEDQIK
jgi:hypothetical protein